MAIIKSNVCNMCGGLLDIDLDRQVYICPFCGVTFDYEYFRKDNVLEIAKKSIIRREFGAAEDAFSYMLKKDPHNFEALRGLILCKCRWTSLTPMLREGEVFLQPNDPVLINAIENCKPEYKEYFNQIQQALNVLQSYRKERSELAKISSDMSVCQNKLRDLRLAQALNNSRFSDAMGDFFDSMIFEDGKSPIPLIIYIGLLIIIGLGYATVVGGQYWIPIVVFGIIGLIVAFYNIEKAITNKSINAAKVPVNKRIEELDKQIDELNEKIKALMREYKTLTATIVNTYPIIDEEGNRINGTSIKSKPKETKKSSDFPSPSGIK